MKITPVREQLVGNRLIQKLGRFVKLASDDIALLESITANARKVPARRDIVREGDTPGPFLIFLEGWACRYKIVPNGQRQVVALLMPGDCCDIHADVLAEMDHSIQMISPGLVVTVPRTTIDEILLGRPVIARALYLSQLVDEAVSRAWIVSMGRRTSQERVAHLMCELYLRGRFVGVIDGDRMALPLTQSLLADALGMTAVHINRVLRTLRLAGAMEIKRGHLEILDPPMLVRIAGFDENYLHRRLRNAA